MFRALPPAASASETAAMSSKGGAFSRGLAALRGGGGTVLQRPPRGGNASSTGTSTAVPAPDLATTRAQLRALVEAQSTNANTNVHSVQEASHQVGQRQQSVPLEVREEASAAPTMVPANTAAQESVHLTPRASPHATQGLAAYNADDDRAKDSTVSVSQQLALLDTFERRIVQGIVLRNTCSGVTAARDLNSTRTFAQLQQLLAGAQTEHLTTSSAAVNEMRGAMQRWASVQSRLGPMGYAAARAEVAAAKILTASYLSEGTRRVVGLVSSLVAAGPADLRAYFGIE